MSTVDNQQSEGQQQGGRFLGMSTWVVVAAIVVFTMTVAVVVIIGGGYLSQRMHKQPIVRITVLYPSMSADAMEKDIASRLARECWSSEGVEEVEAISTVGRADIYLTGRPGTNAEEMLTSIRANTMTAVDRLPGGMQQPVTVLLPDDATIPTVQIQQVDTAVVQLDRERVAALGITLQEISMALSSATDTDDNLDSDTSLTIGDQSIPLSEVATIVQEKRPSHIITTYP